jgi:hypothetical protein
VATIDWSGPGLPEELKNFNERELRWLWRYLLYRTGQTFAEEPSPSQRAGAIATTIASFSDPQRMVQEIVDVHGDVILNANHFDWINGDDDRQLIWLLLHLQNFAITIPGRPPLTVDYVPRKSRREAIITIVDCWWLAGDAKAGDLDNLKNSWAASKTPESLTKWIDPKNPDQLRWAWDYLAKTQKALWFQQPTNDKELHSLILASLDNMPVYSFAERELFITKMKKTWSQKKYRDSGKAKKPYYMPLTDNSQEKLKRLATEKDKKPHEVVEELIQAAAEGI